MKDGLKEADNQVTLTVRLKNKRPHQDGDSVITPQTYTEILKEQPKNTGARVLQKMHENAKLAKLSLYDDENFKVPLYTVWTQKRPSTINVQPSFVTYPMFDTI